MSRQVLHAGKRPAKKAAPHYICDEHNEVFYFWHKSRYEGLIDEPLDLFHLDAHSDMSSPGTLRKSLYYPIGGKDTYLEYYDDFARTELEINNFIVPAVLNGIIRNVYFIYPAWRKLMPSLKALNICSAFSEGRMLKYNVTRQQGASPGTVFTAMPDLKHFSYHAMNIDRIPARRKVILDIDFDYFACRDSAPALVGYEFEITREEFVSRNVNLGSKAFLFNMMEMSFKEKDNRYFAEIGHRKPDDLSYLPTAGEIESEIEKVAAALARKKTVPVVITLCRSCRSGYCPKEIGEFIENRLASMLLTP
jgi:hypothetical protein